MAFVWAPAPVLAQQPAPPETLSVASAWIVPAPARALDTARASRARPAARAASRTAQPFRPARFWLGVGGIAAADVPVMIGLSQIWYGDGGTTSFRWYSEAQHEEPDPTPQYDRGWVDDWFEWKQQDKLGHLLVSWQIAKGIGAYGRWSGLSRTQSALFGGAVSALFMSQIEVFDGHSVNEDGASRTDLLANAAGGFLGSLQVAYPEKLDWFAMKYSYHRSPYYGNPYTGPAGNGLGSYVGNAIKDYDGISYWLVLRPDELLNERYAERWPDWLGLAVGHSATGLGFPKSGGNGFPEHRRQLFIGPDIDVLRSEFLEEWDVPKPLRAVADVLSFLRVPAPALQLTPEVKWYWVFY